MSAVNNNAVEFDFEKLEPIPVAYGFAGLFASVIFFQSLSIAVVRIGSPKSIGKDEQWKWRNLLVSWIHAVIIGIWDLSCFYRYPELMSDLIAYHNIYIHQMVVFSTGYFVYDLIDLFVNQQAFKMWELIPHHLSVAGVFFYNALQSRCLSFNVIALLAEVNSIFLHARKLLQMAGVPYSQPVYRVNAVINLVTFVSCRFVCLIWICYGMAVWYSRVSGFYLAILGATMFILWVINAVLFWRLVCSDLLRFRRRKKSGHAVNNGGKAGDVNANGHVLLPNALDDKVEGHGFFGHKSVTSSKRKGVTGEVLNRENISSGFENSTAVKNGVANSH